MLGKISAFVLVLWLLQSAGAIAGGLSGTYVASSPDAAFLLQIVETTDGQLTGRYEDVALKPSGELADNNAALSGAVNGGTVVATLKPTELLSASITVSGTFDGKTLHLTGGGNSETLRLNLVSGDEAEFQNQVAILTAKGNQIKRMAADKAHADKQAKLQADAQGKAQDLINQTVSLTARLDAVPSWLAEAEAAFHTVTARMQAGLNKQLSIRGGNEAAVARWQISVDIQQAEIGASQLHEEINSARQQFEGKSAPILTKLATAVPGCNSIVGQTISTTGVADADVEAWKAKCAQILESAKAFQARVETTRRAFDQAAAVWDKEHRQQAQIVSTSNANTGNQ
jgi:hypothetical protein